MDQWKCHCHQPATWVVDSFTTLNAYQTWKKNHYVPDSRHVRWATCDEHLAEACRENPKRLTHYPSKLITIVKAIPRENAA